MNNKEKAILAKLNLKSQDELIQEIKMRDAWLEYLLYDTSQHTKDIVKSEISGHQYVLLHSCVDKLYSLNAQTNL